MTRRFRILLLPVLWLGCLHGGDRGGEATRAVGPDPARGSQEAIQRALTFLAHDGDWWMTGGRDVPGGGACVSCHVVAFSVWSHREAERAGAATANESIATLEKRAFDYFDRNPDKRHPVTWGQLLLGREAAASDEARVRMVADRLVAEQEAEGWWEAAGQFPTQRRPERESNEVTTMWTVVALGTIEGLSPAAAASRDRAWRWIGSLAPGQSNEWLLTRLLVERQLGTPAGAESLLGRVLARQQADGGWSWLADPSPPAPSDALSTGQALYTLRLAGLGTEHAAVRRAMEYLLRSQQSDGTWLVPSKLISVKGGTKIEYVYKFWGTAWATIGLARGLAPRPAERPLVRGEPRQSSVF